MSGAGRYLTILRAKHVTPLLLASMLARLPFGMYALAVVLYSAGRFKTLAALTAVMLVCAIGPWLTVLTAIP